MSQVDTVTEQPKGAMEMSEKPKQIPDSLEYLSSLDTVIVRQKVEAFEAMSGIETKNKYRIMNKDFQEIFYAREASIECERIMCAPCRGFTIHVTDNKNLQVMRFIRDFKYCTGCCCCGEGCCNMTVRVESPYGRYLGKATLGNSKCDSHIRVLDETDKHLFTIWIPVCICQDVCCPDDVVIPITDPTLTQQIGRICKVYRGCCVEIIGDADSFRVEFPIDMALNTKMLLMGALFMVDYLRFEAN